MKTSVVHTSMITVIDKITNFLNKNGSQTGGWNKKMCGHGINSPNVTTSKTVYNDNILSSHKKAANYIDAI